MNILICWDSELVVFVKSEPKSTQLKEPKTSVCVHWIYLIHEFHNLSWITEINELFHDILIYWDAPAYLLYISVTIQVKYKLEIHFRML